jgi:hypothetical protein
MRGAVHTINETPPCSPTDGHAASFPRSSPSARIAHSSLPSLHSLHRRVVLLVREARGKLAAGGLAAILALAVKRTVLGVVESSLATPNRPFTPRATAIEFHVDPTADRTCTWASRISFPAARFRNAAGRCLFAALHRAPTFGPQPVHPKPHGLRRDPDAGARSLRA